MPPTFYREDDPDRDTLPETFIDRYTAWGATATDAPVQYHTVNAVSMLSTVMSPYLTLETSYGDIKPNVWTMILAGTTVTRKSTTMDMALKMLHEVHPDFLMGTDGSPEGIMSELATRDGKISLFHRDEITGWIDSTIRRDYLAGMLETFTRLYDGKAEKRILRKESCEVNDPNLVIMSGGIKTKMQEIITMDHIRSGFLPRFIMVHGATKMEDVRPIGPPPKNRHDFVGRDPREVVVEELYHICTQYLPKQKTEEKVEIAGVVKLIKTKPQKTIMTATPEAWERIQQLKFDGGVLGERSTNPDIYIPLFDRLTNTIIKVAMLLCGAESRSEITFTDVVKAISYSDRWLISIVDFAESLERMPDMDKYEKKIDKILKRLKHAGKDGIDRADLMRSYHIRSRDIEDIEKTLVARGQIRIVKVKSNGRVNQYRTIYMTNGIHLPAEGSQVVAASTKEHRDPRRDAEPFFNPKHSDKEYWREEYGTETPSQQLLRMPFGEDG